MAGTWFANLREFACELTSSWPPTRMEGRVLAALLGQNPLNLANLASVPECVFGDLGEEEGFGDVPTS